MWLAIRRIEAVVLLAAGVLMLLVTPEGFWLRTGLAFSAWAIALNGLLVDPVFQNGRQRFGLSTVRVLRLMSAAWVIAGVCGLLWSECLYLCMVRCFA